MDDTVGRTYSKETVAFLGIYPFVLCSTAIVRLYCVVLTQMEYTIRKQTKNIEQHSFLQRVQWAL